MKILIMHNAIPNYRIPWFKNINQMCDAKFVFTNYTLTKKLYHFEIEYEKIADLKYMIMGEKKSFLRDTYEILSQLNNYDFIEFPATDSLKELFLSIVVLIKCKILHIKTGYFWEKWDAPKEMQPIKRRTINWLIGMAAKMIYKHVDLIFAGSRSSKDYFIDHGVEKEKIIILPDASETPKCEIIDLRKKYGIGREKKIILFFGRLLIQKGLRILIEAINRVPNKNDYVLIVAGDGEDRKYCEQLILDYQLQNVIMCGWINPDCRLNYFKQCDIFAFPGIFYQGRVDVWGLTLVEAIQNKKILISTNAVGSAKDLITNGVNGFVLDASNEEQLINELADSIVKCNDELKKSAQVLNEKLAKQYSYKNMADVYLKSIYNLCNVL